MASSPSPLSPSVLVTFTPPPLPLALCGRTACRVLGPPLFVRPWLPCGLSRVLQPVPHLSKRSVRFSSVSSPPPDSLQPLVSPSSLILHAGGWSVLSQTFAGQKVVPLPVLRSHPFTTREELQPRPDVFVLRRVARCPGTGFVADLHASRLCLKIQARKLSPLSFCLFSLFPFAFGRFWVSFYFSA